MTWHLFEAQRFYEAIAFPKSLANAVKLDEWLRQVCNSSKENMVSPRDRSDGAMGVWRWLFRAMPRCASWPPIAPRERLLRYCARSPSPSNGYATSVPRLGRCILRRLGARRGCRRQNHQLRAGKGRGRRRPPSQAWPGRHWPRRYFARQRRHGRSTSTGRGVTNGKVDSGRWDIAMHVPGLRYPDEILDSIFTPPSA
jgi:hypothetical protein